MVVSRLEIVFFQYLRLCVCLVLFIGFSNVLGSLSVSLYWFSNVLGSFCVIFISFSNVLGCVSFLLVFPMF